MRCNPVMFRCQICDSDVADYARDAHVDRDHPGIARWLSAEERERMRVEGERILLEQDIAWFRLFGRRLSRPSSYEPPNGKGRGPWLLKRATPKWANREAMERIHAQAREFRAAGINVNVDHIVPLDGDLVCGLNVEFNLRIVTHAVNLKKSNNFDPLTYQHPLPHNEGSQQGCA